MKYKSKYIGLKKESELVRKLSFLLSSGQGIIESLNVLSITYPEIISIYKNIDEGKSLKNSIKQSTVFSNISVKIIEVGELTGTLSNSLLSLSKYLRQKYEIKNKIVTASIYPLIIYQCL